MVGPMVVIHAGARPVFVESGWDLRIDMHDLQAKAKVGESHCSVA